MKKWYNYETCFTSEAEKMRDFLITEGIKFELSGCYNAYHFEILCSRDEFNRVNDWLMQDAV
jgi:hypothetical protein